MTLPRSIPLLIAMSLFAWCASAQPAAGHTQPAPVTTTHAALLKPEYITQDTKVDRRQLVGWLDTVLTESVTQQKDFVLVDRQALDKVLAEKTLAKLDASKADAKLKPFITSGVLLCPTITADTNTGKAVITVQAVLAQRGTLLAELTVAGELKGDDWKAAPALDEPLKRFWKDLRGQLGTSISLPGLEVRQVSVNSTLDRLQWMADDLTDALAIAPHEGLVLLVPRQPIHTKEERLLRLMGLASPGQDDKSAKLSAASEYQLSGELAEDVKAGVAFAKTPVRLTLRLGTGPKELAKTEFAGTVGDYWKIHQQALAWAAKELSKLPKVTVQPLDESHAKALAQQELGVTKRLLGVSYGGSPMERDRQERLALAALRAAHLDPTSEEAAYLAAMSIGGMYEAREQGGTLACKDRILQVGQQYLDRFGSKVAPHHRDVLDQIGSAGHSGAWVLRGKPGGIDAIGNPPDVRQYPYARAYVRAWMELGIRGDSDKTYGTSNALQSAPGHLQMHLIPNIPDDKLDEEYDFWKQTWSRRIAPLGADKCIPWDCIEMAFAARKKDAAGVRAAAGRLAAIYPKSKSQIWRLITEDTVTLYLRAAGDKQWQTWQPTFAKPSAPKVNYYVVQDFFRRLQPPFLPVWDYANAPAPAATRITFPPSVLDLGKQNYVVPYPKVEYLATCGGDAWFVSGCLWDNTHRARPHSLFVVPLSQLDKPATADPCKPIAVAWPADAGKDAPKPSIKSFCVTGDKDHPVVWLGTYGHGLARFEKKDGNWAGRWYTTKQGMPSDTVHSVAPFRSGGKLMLLLSGGANDKEQYWTLNVQTEAVATLFERKAGSYLAAAVWADGQKVPLSLYNETDYPDLDITKAKELVATEFYSYDSFPLLTRPGGKPAQRLWSVGRSKNYHLDELAVDSLAKLPTPLGNGSRYDGGGNYLWSNMRSFLPGTNPVDEITSAFARGQDIWLLQFAAENMGRRGEGDAICIYRPAPQGDADWARKDLWIGPFKSPDDGPIFGLAPDSEGNVWATCASGVFRIDADQLLGDAVKTGRTSTTAQWRETYPQRLAKANWRVRARTLLATGKTPQALQLVNEQLSALGEVTDKSGAQAKEEWTHLMLYKALAQALTTEGRLSALQTYETVSKSPLAEQAARNHATRNRITVLHEMKRWQEMLDAMTASGFEVDPKEEYGWGPWIRQAQAELKKAATAPATPATPR